MATSLTPPSDADPTSSDFGMYALNDGDMHPTAMQPGTFAGPDADEYSVPGAYAEGQAVTGAQHMPNAAQPGATGVSGGGGDGSTGIVGEVING